MLKDEINFCIICHLSYENFSKEYKGGYCLNKIINHLLDKHNITLEDYLELYCSYNRPICKCGCNNKTFVNFKNTVKSGTIIFNEYIDKHYFKDKNFIKKHSEELKNRTGEKNPMYGKKPWNKGLDKNKNKSLLSVSLKKTGSKMSVEAKHNMSISAMKRKIHGHTGKKHSLETKIKIRLKTIEQIKKCELQQIYTKPTIIFEDMLKKNNISYKREKDFEYFVFDFYLTDYNYYIEIDGDYWHSNPKFYPNGPKTNSQKINFYRDIKKNIFCKKNNIKLLRFWEFDILNNLNEIEKKIKELLHNV